MKDYKRKGYYEKNSKDITRLPKKLKSLLEGSNRAKIRDELKTVEPEADDKDKYYECEMEMSWLCYKVERELGDKYECTCPDAGDEEAVKEHMNYLNRLLLRSVR
jgi:hypothetical protein